jgi:transposase
MWTPWEGSFTMRPKGSADVLEARRKKAIRLLEEEQLSLNAIARQIGCNASSVMRWRDRWNALGEKGLEVLFSPGRPSKLSTRQRAQLVRYLLQGPMSFGWNTDVWTTQRIADLIKNKFSIEYHFAHVGRLMHRLGWSPQKPERRALERNELSIQQWKARNWKRTKKTPRGWAPT